jgi:hypothetical protein
MMSSLLFFRTHVEPTVHHPIPENEHRDFTPNNVNRVNGELAG